MISVVIPTLNAERHLPQTLAALLPAMVEGVVRQVIVSDGGSADATLEMAEALGTDIVNSEPGRGRQLAVGASAARHPWLLFLHADTVLEAQWFDVARRFVEAIENGQRCETAAAFRFVLNDRGLMPRAVEHGVRFRCAFFALPYGDQGLLISRRLYDEIGGYRALPLMEDVEIVHRLGRGRISMLDVGAVTSAERYRRDGYLKRTARNLSCLVLYKLGAPIDRIARIYQGRGGTGRRKMGN